MPIYDYKCEDCKGFFTEAHSFKEKLSNCSLCKSTNIHKAIMSFATKTENSLEGLMRKHEEQGKADVARFQKDDTFAANISGASDANHEKKLQKVLQEQSVKNERAIKTINEGQTSKAIKRAKQ
jgi:putative FmdB family regulatory protein